MIEIAGGILIAAAVLITLPMLAYWLIWLATGKGKPPRSAEQIELDAHLDRQHEIKKLKMLGWAMAALAFYALGFTIFVHWSR